MRVFAPGQMKPKVINTITVKHKNIRLAAEISLTRLHASSAPLCRHALRRGFP